MAEYSNPLSNMSYTAKDFQTIYPELLDLVKKLAVRWDPSISDESDPGVLLLKLNAIIGDKCNYNIDKNVLECFPLSVTQQTNAVQLFEQLGYAVKWYRGATSTLSLKWAGEVNSSYSYNLPAFTMFCDGEDYTVYTTTKSCSILGDGTTVTQVDVIQGVAVEYDINGVKLITSANLDSNNRLYFSDYNVAENGIFIQNISSVGSDYTEWERVSNLATQPLGTKCYKFGISKDAKTCYIEFPEDVDSLLGQGIYVTYIKTDGSAGNVAARAIEKFYGDVSVVDPADSESTVALTTENVLITNPSAILGGRDPESISESYANYKKTVGTFDTLVTLRDYMNAILSSEYVSNCFVCDRTNDIQSSYIVLEDDGTFESNKLYVEETLGVPELLPFDLRLYLLQYVDTPNTAALFNSTFDMIPDSSVQQDFVKSYLKEKSDIQHDYSNLIPSRVCLFKNKFPIDCKIVPQYQLTALQISDVKQNIYKAIFNAINASKLSFGAEINYDELYQTISSADQRIKSVVLDDFTYTTYAVYYDLDSRAFREVEISSSSTSGLSADDATFKTNLRTDIVAKSVLAGKTQLLLPDTTYTSSLVQTEVGSVDNIRNLSTNVDITLFAPGDTSTEASYTLRANENIQFSAPNLIDDTSFSSYVKYECYLGEAVRTLPANSDYMLDDGEYIIFYWKESDDDLEPYSYRIYTGGSTDGQIIHPSFALQSMNVIYGADLVDGLSAGSVKSGICDSVLSDNIQGLVDSKHFLTSTKSITVRKKNQVVLDAPSTPCYWVLNTQKVLPNGTKVYELFSADVSASNYLEYTLKSGEYFIYTNEARSDLVILMSGTKIVRTLHSGSSGNAWQVEVKDVSSIAYDGLAAFSESDWFNFIPSSSPVASLTITEMRYINLGEGVTINVTRSSDYLTESLVFTSEGIGSADLSHFTITYSNSSDGTSSTLPTVALGAGEGWKGYSVLDLFLSPSRPQMLLANQYFSYTDTSGNTGDIGKRTQGSDFTQCTAASVFDPSLQYFVLNSGVYYYKQDLTEDVFNSSKTSYYTPNNPVVYVLSNIELNEQGGLGLDTSIINQLGEISYLSLFSYVPSTNTGDNSHFSGDIFIASFDAPEGSSVTTTSVITCNLRQGTYILPLHNTVNDFTTLTVTHKIGSGTANSVAEIASSVSDFKTSRTYYLLITKGSSGTDTITISGTRSGDSTSDVQVTFDNLFKFDYPVFVSPSVSDVLTRITTLDTNHVYNWTHIVPDSLKISDPLDPLSFLDSNHIFNSSVICQLETSSLANLVVLNKVK